MSDDKDPTDNENGVPWLYKVLSSNLDKDHPLLKATLTVLVMVVGWSLYILSGPLQANIKDYTEVVSEFPLEKDRRVRLEQDVRDIRLELKEQRAVVNDINADIKLLVRRNNGR